MEKTAKNHQSNKSVAIIKIHDDYCNGSDENLMEQLSALLQSVYIRKTEDPIGSMSVS